MNTVLLSPPGGEKVVLTPTEFAALFGRHYSWAYRQIYAGKIQVIHDLGRIMIPRSEVERLLESKERYNGKTSSRVSPTSG
jgi:predicted site-specific integrase-resolvase